LFFILDFKCMSCLSDVFKWNLLHFNCYCHDLGVTVDGVWTGN
jgi:hypothetical protein